MTKRIHWIIDSKGGFPIISFKFITVSAELSFLLFRILASNWNSNPEFRLQCLQTTTLCDNTCRETQCALNISLRRTLTHTDRKVVLVKCQMRNFVLIVGQKWGHNSSTNSVWFWMKNNTTIISRCKSSSFIDNKLHLSTFIKWGSNPRWTAILSTPRNKYSSIDSKIQNSCALMRTVIAQLLFQRIGWNKNWICIFFLLFSGAVVQRSMRLWPLSGSVRLSLWSCTAHWLWLIYKSVRSMTKDESARILS